MSQYRLELYISGTSYRSQQAMDNLQHLCEQVLPGNYEIVVIDILEQPQLAEQLGVLATPLVIKYGPGSTRRVVGDFSDPQEVLRALRISSVPTLPISSK